MSLWICLTLLAKMPDVVLRELLGRRHFAQQIHDTHWLSNFAWKQLLSQEALLESQVSKGWAPFDWHYISFAGCCYGTF